MAIATGGADVADDRQRNVLSGHARAQRTLDPYQHRLHLFLQQALGGEHVLDLGGADAMRQTAECTMRGGVRVAANHRHARQRGAVLRSDDVDDALPRVLKREIRLGADRADVGVQRLDLLARHRILDAAVPMVGGRVVVGGGDNARDTPRLATSQAQTLERLWAGHFVH